ncbi:hypothetical protein [Micromonospora sp. NPDC002717]|uniref:hypothetical protein n=1 Tax=Micromonospora sp. NPDC002717 TaxID=3154424 RepID=UPI00332483CB
MAGSDVECDLTLIAGTRRVAQVMREMVSTFCTPASERAPISSRGLQCVDLH